MKECVHLVSKNKNIENKKQEVPPYWAAVAEDKPSGFIVFSKIFSNLYQLILLIFIDVFLLLFFNIIFYDQISVITTSS